MQTEDAQTQRAVENYLQHPVNFVLADPISLNRALDRVHQKLSLGDVNDAQVVPSAHDADNPVALCNTLIQAAVLRGASVRYPPSPSEQSLAIHLRVDGQLEFYGDIAKQVQLE